MAGVPQERIEAQGEDTLVLMKAELELMNLLARKQQTLLGNGIRKMMQGSILPTGNKTQQKP